ncbi:MAG: NAD(P)-dependent alcohol dehydrogenase [Rhodobacterales bacterium]|nr:NAD(P)-dependent alcohol dehydrogenase [Rhodobacterales bacterium]
MKAAVYRRYGPPDVVKIEEIPTPTPRDNEVLIRVNATTVSTADWRLRSLTLPPGFGPFGRLAIGITGPRKPVLGTELSGVITSVGSNVTRFKPGEAVVAFPGIRMGAHAEYRALPETALIVPKPANLTHDQAAALSFGGTTALWFLREKGSVRPGDHVLILGASGSVGTAAIQIARALGATVTATASPRNLALVWGLGADHVIDYTTEDVLRTPGRFTHILDTLGVSTYAATEHLLLPGGRYLMVAGSLGQNLAALRKHGDGRKHIAGTPSEKAMDLATLARWATESRLTPVIDSVHPLTDIAKAHAIVEKGHKRGNVVVHIAD